MLAAESDLSPTRAAYWTTRRSITPTTGYHTPRPSTSHTIKSQRDGSPGWSWEDRYRPAAESPSTPLQRSYGSRSGGYDDQTLSRFLAEDTSPSTPRPHAARESDSPRGRDSTARVLDDFDGFPESEISRRYRETTFSKWMPEKAWTPRPIATSSHSAAADDRSVRTAVAHAVHRGLSPQPVRPVVHRRAPSMIKDPLSTFLPPQHPKDSHRFCLALDLDETLVYAREGPLRIRPFAQEFLKALYDMDCEVIVWTAGERDYAQSVIKQIDLLGTIEHCVYRHPKWWTGQMGYSKNLRALGRNLSRTLLVDNTPDCLKEHPQHGLLVSDFDGPRAYDDCLRALLHLVKAIIEKPHDSVPRIMSEHPELVRRQTVPLDSGGHINVWTLVDDDIVSRPDYRMTRYNRDSPIRSFYRGRW